MLQQHKHETIKSFSNNETSFSLTITIPITTISAMQNKQMSSKSIEETLTI